MTWPAALLLLFAMLPGIAIAAPCGAPAKIADGWPVSPPAAQGLDPEQVCAIGPQLQKLSQADANGVVVVVRHGTLVYEAYFTGDDRPCTAAVRDWLRQPLRPVPHDAATKHTIQSVTKSVVALLVGIAVDRGWLKDLGAPVFSFFPEYADLRTPEKDSITLRELLTMTSGLAWPEGLVPYSDPSNINRRRYAAPDADRFVLEQKLAAPPGTVWNYNSGGVGLLGHIVQKVAGRPLDRLAEEALVRPLGITDWLLSRMAGADPSASGGLCLRPRDLAKIGQLVLNRGLWRGRRIVSAAWIRAMTTPHAPEGRPFGRGGKRYGYLWWLGSAGVGERRINWAGGIGYGGQELYVVPELDLVVVVTAGVYRRSLDQALAGETALGLVLRAATGKKARAPISAPR